MARTNKHGKKYYRPNRRKKKRKFFGNQYTQPASFLVECKMDSETSGVDGETGLADGKPLMESPDKQVSEGASDDDTSLGKADSLEGYGGAAVGMLANFAPGQNVEARAMLRKPRYSSRDPFGNVPAMKNRKIATNLEKDVAVKEGLKVESDMSCLVANKTDPNTSGVVGTVDPISDFSMQNKGETGLADDNTQVAEGAKDDDTYLRKAYSLDGCIGAAVGPISNSASDHVEENSILQNRRHNSGDSNLRTISVPSMLPPCNITGLSDAGIQAGGVEAGTHYSRDGNPEAVVVSSAVYSDTSNQHVEKPVCNFNQLIEVDVGDSAGLHLLAVAAAAASTTELSQYNSGQSEWTYYECVVCGHKTNDSSNFGRHIQTHTKEKPFACDICDYRASQAGNLKRHQLVHKSVRDMPFSCSLCTYKCDRGDKLDRHMIKHVDYRPYPCDQCKYTAKTEKQLENHQRSHADSRPHACPRCNYRAIQKNQLLVHMRIHTGERPFVCKYKRCNFSFRSASCLKTHERYKHSEGGSCNYTCDTCHKKCAGAKEFKAHMMTHTEVKDEEL